MKAALILAFLLTGCASLPAGVEMNDDEKKACEAETCSVWTPSELEMLVREIFKRGYAAGVKSI